MQLEHVRIPVGNGKLAEKSIGRSLDVLSAIRKSIVAVNAALCLAHALIIAMVLVMVTPSTHYIHKVNV